MDINAPAKIIDLVQPLDRILVSFLGIRPESFKKEDRRLDRSKLVLNFLTQKGARKVHMRRNCTQNLI